MVIYSFLTLNFHSLPPRNGFLHAVVPGDGDGSDGGSPPDGIGDNFARVGEEAGVGDDFA